MQSGRLSPAPPTWGKVQESVGVVHESQREEGQEAGDVEAQEDLWQGYRVVQELPRGIMSTRRRPQAKRGAIHAQRQQQAGLRAGVPLACRSLHLSTISNVKRTPGTGGGGQPPGTSPRGPGQQSRRGCLRGG